MENIFGVPYETLAVFAIVVLFSAFVAAMVWMYAPPKTKFDMEGFLGTFVGCLIAAIVAGWAAYGAGMDIGTFQAFALITGTAVGGLAGVSALLGLNVVKPTA